MVPSNRWMPSSPLPNLQLAFSYAFLCINIYPMKQASVAADAIAAMLVVLHLLSLREPTACREIPWKFTGREVRACDDFVQILPCELEQQLRRASWGCRRLLVLRSPTCLLTAVKLV